MIKLTLNPLLVETLFRLKPLCESIMVRPTPEHIAEFMAAIPTLKRENLQELHQYILFPFLTHLKAPENEGRYNVLIPVIETMTSVIVQIEITTFEVALKTQVSLLSLVFDRAKEGMLARVPEEMKMAVMKASTAMMLNTTPEVKLQLLRTQVPVLAQAVFVSVHIAKLDKMKALRLASLECLKAHTMSHTTYLDDSLQLKHKEWDEPTADYLATILPGSLAALQDVAVSLNNPGHAVIVSALETIHRMLCITMHNRRLHKRRDVSIQDFTDMIAKSNVASQDDKGKQKCKDVKVRSQEWYKLAGEKLWLVTRSLSPLVSHDHYLVRRELAILCGRIIEECCDVLTTSVPLALDILISLSKDPYKEVSQFCISKVQGFLRKASPERRMIAMDGLCENFFTTLTNLPRILNNIDSSRKLSTLNLVSGYIEVLSDQARPQRLTVAISAADRCDLLCDALVAAAALQHELALLTRQPQRDITSAPVSYCPWLQLRHLDSAECQRALESLIRQLAAAECAELLLDRLLELFHQRRDCELVYIMNWMGSASDGPTSLAKRIIDTYIEEDIWYLPLDIDISETALTKEDTLDPEVYNPRAWIKDSVPGLYEGAVEVRYTDISYQYARVHTQPSTDACRTVAESQRNLAMSCLLTEGVGVLAKRLKDEYQPFLLKTLCLILERVGSKYEILHNSGTKALNDIAEACSLQSAGQLIARNADYFTSQISSRLKKAWDVQSALQILTVVMTYSDTSILDYLYAIVEDVLVQSCDKYHQKDLFAYLQVFECFVYCMHQWFPVARPCPQHVDEHERLVREYAQYVEHARLVERLLSADAGEEDEGQSAEDMYREDLKRAEEDGLEYQDAISNEPPPLPKHISVASTILKRTVNFVATRDRDEGILSMHILVLGLPLLRDHEDELLPLVHQIWQPLVTKFVPQEPLVMKKAFELLVVMADVSKDFIRSRVVKEVFPYIFKFLSKSASESYLKDSGAAYRLSAAYSLQVAMLTKLAFLAKDLQLDGKILERAMTCVDTYLSRKQPKQLQALAVRFYKVMLLHNYGLAWYHLRLLCDNADLLLPPRAALELRPVVGTPYHSSDLDINANIRRIFDLDDETQ